MFWVVLWNLKEYENTKKICFETCHFVDLPTLFKLQRPQLEFCFYSNYVPFIREMQNLFRIKFFRILYERNSSVTPIII